VTILGHSGKKAERVFGIWRKAEIRIDLYSRVSSPRKEDTTLSFGS